MSRCDECPKPGYFHGKDCWVMQANNDMHAQKERTEYTLCYECDHELPVDDAWECDSCNKLVCQDCGRGRDDTGFFCNDCWGDHAS